MTGNISVVINNLCVAMITNVATSDPRQVRRTWSKFPSTAFSAWPPKATELCCAGLPEASSSDGAARFQSTYVRVCVHAAMPCGAVRCGVVRCAAVQIGAGCGGRAVTCATVTFVAVSTRHDRSSASAVASMGGRGMAGTESSRVNLRHTASHAENRARVDHQQTCTLVRSTST